MDGQVTNFTTLVVVVLLAVSLYYLYKFLYGTGGIVRYDVLKGPRNAVRKDTEGIMTRSDVLPPLYEGGEYAVSFWIYINDYKYRRDLNKHVLSLGGTGVTGFDTLRVYLGAFKNTLSVRVHSRATGSTPAGAVASGPVTDTLPRAGFNSDFDQIPQGLDQSFFPSCDLTAVDLQRWVNITVALNGRTCDVYMDGKLARSCVLPSFYKVDPAGYQLSLLDKGGFGGYVSNVSTFGYALNPEEVYRIYMAGPGPQYTLYQWLTSLFDPKAVASLEYPKMN
jgi:hypothetical protein